MGNVVFANPQIQRKTPPCPSHSKPMATAIRLLRANALAPDKVSVVEKRKLKIMVELDRKTMWEATAARGAKKIILNLKK